MGRDLFIWNRFRFSAQGGRRGIENGTRTIIYLIFNFLPSTTLLSLFYDFIYWRNRASYVRLLFASADTCLGAELLTGQG